MAFLVSDLDVSIRFYTKRLGLRLLSREEDITHHEAFAFLELEGGNLELLQVLDDDGKPVPFKAPDIRPPYCPHLAIQTDDLDHAMVGLRNEGVPILKGPLEIPGKVKWAYFSDPDNNIVEFVEWL